MGDAADVKGCKSPRSKATPSSQPTQHKGEMINGTIWEKYLRSSSLPLWPGHHEPISEAKPSPGWCHIKRPQIPPFGHRWEPVGICPQQSCCWPLLCAAGLRGSGEGEEMPMGTTQGKHTRVSLEGLCPVSATRAFHMRSWVATSCCGTPLVNLVARKKKKKTNLLQIQLYHRLDFSSSYRLTPWSLWPLDCCYFSGATPDVQGFKSDQGLTSTGEKWLQKVIKIIYSFFFTFFLFQHDFIVLPLTTSLDKALLKALKSQRSSTY